MIERCEFCYYYDGLCKRYPPQMVFGKFMVERGLPKAEIVIPHWPAPNPDDGCGEFKRQPPSTAVD